VGTSPGVFPFPLASPVRLIGRKVGGFGGGGVSSFSGRWCLWGGGCLGVLGLKEKQNSPCQVMCSRSVGSIDAALQRASIVGCEWNWQSIQGGESVGQGVNISHGKSGGGWFPNSGPGV